MSRMYKNSSCRINTIPTSDTYAQIAGSSLENSTCVATYYAGGFSSYNTTNTLNNSYGLFTTQILFFHVKL